MRPPILFYLPPPHWPETLPEVYDTRWPGFGPGHYSWTLQTHLLLKAEGIETELVPDVRGRAGIVIAHRATLAEDFQPEPDQLLVCIQADWGRHPYAQAHICQNRAQTRGEGRRLFYQLFWPARTYFVHHWPQPGLRTRHGDRPDELRTLSYYGLDYNLARELRSDDWRDFLAEQGIEWRRVEKMADWDDFTQTDAVLFCRDFKGNPHYNKPATKLYNAWLAGCLPICTPESAFIEECGRDDPAAVIVDDYASLKARIRQLCQNPDLFARKLDAARSRASDYNISHIAAEWRAVFAQLREHDYPRFTRGSAKRWLFLRTRALSALSLKALGRLTA